MAAALHTGAPQLLTCQLWVNSFTLSVKEPLGSIHSFPASLSLVPKSPAETPGRKLKWSRIGIVRSRCRNITQLSLGSDYSVLLWKRGSCPACIAIWSLSCSWAPEHITASHPVSADLWGVNFRIMWGTWMLHECIPSTQKTL